MFRYSDYVTYLGGGEYELGWIVGVGMLGALAMRVFQGIAIVIVVIILVMAGGRG